MKFVFESIVNLVLIFIIIYAVLPNYKASDICNSDVDCNNQTQFCNSSFICEPCINCTVLNRYPTSISCPKNVVNDCGSCFSGYYSDGIDTCSFVEDEDSPPNIAIIVGAVTLGIAVCALIACLVTYFIVTAMEKRKRKNKKPEQESTPELQDLNVETEDNCRVSSEARQKL